MDSEHTPSPIGPGTVIDGRYGLVSELGRGAWSVVYLAHQASLDRHVAVKVIEPSRHHGAHAAERALREARLVAELAHPHVVTVYDCGSVGGRPYIVMEHVRGPSLAHVLDTKGRLPPKQALDLFVQLAAALYAAHQRGVVHRDVKPANVLLMDTGRGAVRAKLTDFGVAGTHTSQITHQGTVIGTPAYMPPEQARGLPVDRRADIYGLGVLMFRTLTGSMPYDGDDALAMSVQHVTQPVPWFHSKDPDLDVPPKLEAIVRRCLAKHPRDRYPHANELLADLEAVGRGSPVLARFERLVAHGVGRMRRLRPSTVAARRQLATGLVVGLTTTLVAAASLGSCSPESVHASTISAPVTLAASGSAEVWLDNPQQRFRLPHGAVLPGVYDIVARAAQGMRTVGRVRISSPDPVTIHCGLDVGCWASP